jgi:hypothetical protein
VLHDVLRRICTHVIKKECLGGRVNGSRQGDACLLASTTSTVRNTRLDILAISSPERDTFLPNLSIITGSEEGNVVLEGALM